MNELATAQQQLSVQEPKPAKAVVLAGDRGLHLDSIESMWRFAVMAVNSQIYKDLPSPEVAMIKIQAGLELGLTPVWALTNIFVVNGKPTVYGDALLGIILAHPLCEDVIESTEGDGEKLASVCEVRRRGRAPVIRRFSVGDAKKAGLWAKAGPWTQYGQRMLSMRARSWACRDAFADALRGLGVREELENLPTPQAKVREVSTKLVLPDEPDPAPEPEPALDAKNEAGEFQWEAK